MCCFQWALPERGRGGVKACPDSLEHFFHVCLFDRGGGGSKLFDNAHIEPKRNFFKRELEQKISGLSKMRAIDDHQRVKR